VEGNALRKKLLYPKLRAKRSFPKEKAAFLSRVRAHKNAAKQREKNQD